MKTIKIKTAFLLFLAGFLAISINGNSQGVKPDKKERKEAKKTQLAANFYVQDSLLFERNFVLEADYLQNKIGEVLPVSNTLNFLKVDGARGILQTGSDYRSGYNGFGGVTVDGNIDAYKIYKDLKSLNHRVTFNLLSNLGSFNVDLNVSADNSASATITGTTSGRLTWRGHLKSLASSRAYKGAVIR